MHAIPSLCGLDFGQLDRATQLSGELASPKQALRKKESAQPRKWDFLSPGKKHIAFPVGYMSAQPIPAHWGHGVSAPFAE